MRFREVRHSTASLMLAQGVPLRSVMEVLGHSTIALTANTYDHLFPNTFLGSNRTAAHGPSGRRGRKPTPARMVRPGIGTAIRAGLGLERSRLRVNIRPSTRWRDLQ